MKRDKGNYKIRIRPIYMLSYLISWGFLLSFFLFFKSYYFLDLLVIVSCLPILTIGLAIWSYSRLNLEIHPVNEQVRQGEQGAFILRLLGKGLLWNVVCRGELVNAFYGTGAEIDIEMPVTLRGEEELRLPVSSSYCGKMVLRVEYIDYVDLIGLVRVHKTVQSKGEIYVLPEENVIERVQRDGFMVGMSDLDESTAKGYDSADVTDMREYRPGDRIKDIHWKVSAKWDKLMVKERSSVAQSQLVFVLGYSNNRQETEEVLRFAYGTAKEFLKEYVPIRILWWIDEQKNFGEILIPELSELNQKFQQVMGEKKTSEELDYPLFMARMRPEIKAYVVLHYREGQVEGEVISHE